MDVIAEANRIKERLRTCTTVEQVYAVACEERAAVAAMAKLEDGKPLAIQMANLKAYRLVEIQRKT